MRLAMWVVLGAMGMAFVTGAPPDARAQTDTGLGSPDTLFSKTSRTPITYDTSYDRNVSTGTWTQALTYGLTSHLVAFSANGSFTGIDFAHSQGLGAENGTLTGQLNLRANQHLMFGMIGNFNHVGTHDIVSNTSQRQNRFQVNGVYNVNPFKSLLVTASISSELQEDNSLTIRPLGEQGQLRTFPRYNSAGDSVGVDSIFVHDQRDSTLMSGRQDGLNAQVTWKPKPWLQWVSSGSGTRVNQKTRTHLRDFGTTVAGNPVEVPEPLAFNSPNQNEGYQTKLTYTGDRGFSTWLNLKSLANDQGYYDKSLRGEEKLSVDQRTGMAHMEYSPIKGGQVSLDGKIESILSQYLLRASRTSYVYSRSMISTFSYMPSPRGHAGIDFSVENRANSRQQNGNGRTISRFADMSGAYRFSRRLAIDGTSSISLLSSQYVQAALDQDNVRGYVNVGGVYVISARCSTFVHFSVARSHSVAIDPSRSGNNNFQTSYQMDAQLKLGVTSRMSILQNYLLNAIYQIYDDPLAESKNVLSRIKRIDTTVGDSLFPFATVGFVHNFLFRDSGSYTRPEEGGSRLYSVGNETFQQSLGATVNVKPLDGIQLSATQSLGNAKVNFPSSGTRTVSNRWNLALGATVNKNLGGSASLQGSVQHIGAYTERINPGDALSEEDDWLAGVTFHKEF